MEETQMSNVRKMQVRKGKGWGGIGLLPCVA